MVNLNVKKTAIAVFAGFGMNALVFALSGSVCGAVVVGFCTAVIVALKEDILA